MDVGKVAAADDIMQENASPKAEGEGGISSDILHTVSKARQLIELIRDESFLYNPKHDSYRNLLLKDKKWKEIALCMEWTDLQCKLKWKALRDQYSRELKRMKADSVSYTKWKYFKELDFLRAFTLSRSYRRRNKSCSSKNIENMPSKQETSLIADSNAEQNWSYYEMETIEQQPEDTHIDDNMVEHISLNDMSQEELSQAQTEVEEDDDTLYHFLKIEGYFEKDLIDMIRGSEILYCQTHPDYRNVHLKEDKWKEISLKTKKSVKQCRLKWKALRDQYCRESRRLKSLTESETLSRWKHFEALSFLENYINKRKTAPFLTNDIQLKTEEVSPFNTDGYIMDPGEETAHNHNDEFVHAMEDFVESNQEESHELSYMAETVTTKIQAETRNSQNLSANCTYAENNEVEIFFQTVAMKVRNAKMTDLAFTELQISILKVITDVMRKNQ